MSPPPASQDAPRAAADDKQRNPHPDFKLVESQRPPFAADAEVQFTKTPNPDWKYGDGANHLAKSSATANHISIDPFAQGRHPSLNYKLLISGITPRPIALISTQSSPSSSNLAPFSFFNMVNFDPPIFVVGFACSLSQPKDTLRNLVSTRECVINIISESYLEAANSTSLNGPPEVDEWTISGLTPLSDCQTVKCPRAKESIFSIEAKLESLKEFESRNVPGKKTGTMAVLEGTWFWAREDAVNEDRSRLDLDILRPISRLGGITYSRSIDTMELPRPDFNTDLGGLEGYDKIKAKVADRS